MSAYPRGLTLVGMCRMCLVDVPVDCRRPRYLALSYVWSFVSQRLLRRAVREKWHAKGGLRVKNTPKTITDAIRLTEMVDYEYVWIDALCTARQRQIAPMHTIYQQAGTTIVAADGSRCTEGLPGASTTKSRMERHDCIDLPEGLRFQKAPLSTRHSI